MFIPDLDANTENHPNPTNTSLIRSQHSSDTPTCHTVIHERWRYLTTCPNFPHLRLRLEPPRPCCAPDIAAGSDRLQLRHTGLLSVLSVRTASPLSLTTCCSAVQRLSVLTVQHSHDPHAFDSAKKDEERTRINSF